MSKTAKVTPACPGTCAQVGGLVPVKWHGCWFLRLTNVAAEFASSIFTSALAR